jgi:hypothetical protein
VRYGHLPEPEIVTGFARAARLAAIPAGESVHDGLQTVADRTNDLKLTIRYRASGRMVWFAMGYIEDISLSGVDHTERALAADMGEPVPVFIREVGFVDGLMVRRTGRFLGVQFKTSAPPDPQIVYSGV